jgi:hypothetical protein
MATEKELLKREIRKFFRDQGYKTVVSDHHENPGEIRSLIYKSVESHDVRCNVIGSVVFAEYDDYHGSRDGRWVRTGWTYRVQSLWDREYGPGRLHIPIVLPPLDLFQAPESLADLLETPEAWAEAVCFAGSKELSSDDVRVVEVENAVNGFL